MLFRSLRLDLFSHSATLLNDRLGFFFWLRLDLFSHSATLLEDDTIATRGLRLDLFSHSATLPQERVQVRNQLRLDLFSHSATLLISTFRLPNALRLDLFSHSATLYPTKNPANAGKIVGSGWEKGGFEGVFCENRAVFLSKKTQLLDLRRVFLLLSDEADHVFVLLVRYGEDIHAAVLRNLLFYLPQVTCGHFLAPHDAVIDEIGRASWRERVFRAV